MNYHQRKAVIPKYFNLSGRLSLIFFFFILLSSNMEGQGNLNEKSLLVSIKAFAGNSSVIDYKFSSIPFKGFNPGASLSLKFRRTRMEHEIQGLFTKGKLKADKFPNDVLNQKIINLDYNALWYLASENNRLQIKAGGALQLLYAERIYNGFINMHRSFETLVSIGPVTEINYYLPQVLDGIAFSDRIILPLLFSYSQSPYLSDEFYNSDLKNNHGLGLFFSQNQIAAIAKIFRITNSFAVEKEIAGKHFISLTYRWDFYHLKTSREVLEANHQPGISYTYKF